VDLHREPGASYALLYMSVASGALTIASAIKRI
jgi:hypothetical protein